MKPLITDLACGVLALALFAGMVSYLLGSQDGVWFQACGLLICLALTGGLQAVVARR